MKQLEPLKQKENNSKPVFIWDSKKDVFKNEDLSDYDQQD